MGSNAQPYMCAGCGKVVTGDHPDRCQDCGDHFFPASEDDLACDACGDPDGLRLMRTDRRLCRSCIRETRLDAIVENAEALRDMNLDAEDEEAVERLLTIRADAHAVLEQLGVDM